MIDCPICGQSFDPEALGLSADEYNAMLFGYRLAALRRKTPRPFDNIDMAAAKVGVGRETLLSWERGIRLPSLKNALAMAKLYEVTLNDLCEGMIVELQG